MAEQEAVVEKPGVVNEEPVSQEQEAVDDMSVIFPRFSDVRESSPQPKDKKESPAKVAEEKKVEEAQKDEKPAAEKPGSKTPQENLLAALHNEREEKRKLREELAYIKGMMENKNASPAQEKQIEKMTEEQKAKMIEEFLADPHASMQKLIDTARKDITKEVEDRIGKQSQQTLARFISISEREAKKVHADYDDVVIKSGFSDSLRDSPAMWQLISSSDNPGETAYEMALKIHFPERLEADKKASTRKAILEELGLTEEDVAARKAQPKQPVKPAAKPTPPSRLGDVPAASKSSAPAEDDNNGLPHGNLYA
jgi:hypothetical protein